MPLQLLPFWALALEQSCPEMLIGPALKNELGRRTVHIQRTQARLADEFSPIP